MVTRHLPFSVLECHIILWIISDHINSLFSYCSVSYRVVSYHINTISMIHISYPFTITYILTVCILYSEFIFFAEVHLVPGLHFWPVLRKVSAAVSDVLEATAAMDLGALAAALANFQLFEGGVGVSESQQEDVVQVGCRVRMGGT